MIVAIMGAAGSFSEIAALRLAGPEAAFLRCATFSDVFLAVASGRAGRGVVPVRNSIAGPVDDNADRAGSGAFDIVGAIPLPVRQCLIARAGTPLRTVRRIASHPVALRQCTRFLASHGECVVVDTADTASGVRDLMLGTLAADAVIGSATAAATYGAEVLIERVDDDPDNFTEFVLFEAGRSGASLDRRYLST